MTTITIDPSTLTKNQQTFIAKYEELQQTRILNNKDVWGQTFAVTAIELAG